MNDDLLQEYPQSVENNESSGTEAILDPDILQDLDTLLENLDNIESESNIQSESSEEALERNTIPTNSESLLIDEKTSRFSGAVWYNSIINKKVTLAGLGGIGSWTALLLGRLNIDSLIMFDPDTVESGNISGQLHSISNIGRSKVESVANTLIKYASYNRYICIDERFESNSIPSDIMICGFDNMESRKVFFNKWIERVLQYKGNKECERDCLFIDARLAAEEFQVLCIRGDDIYNIDRYIKEFLFSDLEAETTECSYKQTSFCANMVASVIVNLFVNFVANSLNPIVPRDLPFYTMYNAETMYFKTEA